MKFFLALFLLCLGAGWWTTPSLVVQAVCLGETNTAVVDGCVCDTTCETCGFYGNAVSNPDDCLTCPTHSSLTVLYEDGSGICGSSVCVDPNTFVPVLDEPCSCHPSCATCGYYGSPTTNPDDCFSCADPGVTLNVLYTDGTGTCDNNGGGDGGTTTVESPPVQAPVASSPVAQTGELCFMVFQMAGK